MARWLAVSGEEAERLEQELARELPRGHELDGRPMQAHARRDACDDVAYLLDDGRLCVVHLTWKVETNPRWPAFEFVAELDENARG